jgi:hypothetical protein
VKPDIKRAKNADQNGARKRLSEKVFHAHFPLELSGSVHSQGVRISRLMPKPKHFDDPRTFLHSIEDKVRRSQQSPHTRPGAQGLATPGHLRQ